MPEFAGKMTEGQILGEYAADKFDDANSFLRVQGGRISPADLKGSLPTVEAVGTRTPGGEEVTTLVQNVLH